MGLRYRKSITLCKGVRLNVGKTGVSISAGIPGFRKTIHSSGRVTTSIGIPGTGVYYVDTQNPKKKTNLTQKRTQHHEQVDSWIPVPQSPGTPKAETRAQPIYKQPYAEPAHPIKEHMDSRHYSPIREVSSEADDSVISEQFDFTEREIIETPPFASENNDLECTSNADLPSSVATSLFEHCDYPVKWIDVLTNAEPPEDSYNTETWEYLRSKAIAIFDGDVDAMFEVIERVNPYDDLLDYLTDFQFEADDSEHIEITCAINPSSLGAEKETAAASVILRLARDTFALLPILTIRIRVHNVPDGVMDEVCFERRTFACTTFTNSNPVKLMAKLCVQQ